MSERFFRNHILHIDMDAFYASVEQLDNPEWRGLPLIVGSAPDKRGVVTTCSYEARRYGVHSAMPSRTAYRLCPQGIFVRGRPERYAELSAQIETILRNFTPYVEMLSIDEAFLDINGVLDIRDPFSAAQDIKNIIKRETGLTASAGVASNKFLAKLASDMQKPDGLTVLPDEPDEIIKFLAPLPLRKIWGVGAKTAEKLHNFGLKKVQDVQNCSAEVLIRILGPASGQHLYELCRGIDHRKVEWQERVEKSISREETFLNDCNSFEKIRDTLFSLCEEVAARLRYSGLFASCATIKIRFSNFHTITRQMQIRPATQADRVLLAYAEKLLQQINFREEVRLVGFGVSNLAFPEELKEQKSKQLMLFEEEILNEEMPYNNEKNTALDKAVDQLREKFGSNAIKRLWNAKNNGKDS